MGWVKRKMEASRPVRGVIVANAIGKDPRFAVADIPDVRLIEYPLSFSPCPVD